MLLSDRQIHELAMCNDMITPFFPELIRRVSGSRVISFGLSSYGYDIRLSEAEFRVFRHIPGEIVDPKNFNPKYLEWVDAKHDDNGTYFIIPGNSYALGVAVEKLHIPDDVTVICLGKSTYARCGIIANVTPAESAWRGHLTLEFSNSSNADCKIYANEGVLQLLFLRGEKCNTTYSDRHGKYQDQPERIILSRL